MGHRLQCNRISLLSHGISLATQADMAIIVWDIAIIVWDIAIIVWDIAIIVWDIAIIVWDIACNSIGCRCHRMKHCMPFNGILPKSYGSSLAIGETTHMYSSYAINDLQWDTALQSGGRLE